MLQSTRLPADEPASVSSRLHEVLDRIDHARRRSGRDDRVRLVAVSKKQPIERIRAAYDAGARDFGENYADELFERIVQWPQPDVQWHYLGRVTQRLLPRLAQAAAWIHGISKQEHLEKLGALQQGGNPIPRLLVQVNIGQEAQKQGVDPSQVPELLEKTRGFNVTVAGLMMIGPVRESEREIRGDFAELRTLRDRVSREISMPLPELSMGMSGDYEIAVEEGATMVRVGEAIFGPRVKK